MRAGPSVVESMPDAVLGPSRCLDHPKLAAYKHGLLEDLRARSSVVEHLTFTQGVDGSIPSGLTNVSGLLLTFGARAHGLPGNPGAIPAR